MPASLTDAEPEGHNNLALRSPGFQVY